jgi:hypothetical protein
MLSKTYVATEYCEEARHFLTMVMRALVNIRTMVPRAHAGPGIQRE